MTLPLKSGDWTPTLDQLVHWTDAYPGLDVERELAKMLAWLNANPRKRKTARGMPRFVVNWLNRASRDARRDWRPAVQGPSPEILAQAMARARAQHGG